VRNRVFWLFALLLAVSARPALAQGGAGGSTGTIQGEVTDASGAILPGVTVTVTGPMLLASQTGTTNAQGIYRFAGLPAGTYKLSFELSGFGKVAHDDVRVGIGFTATVNAKLSVKSMQEEVTVTGESTVIDTAANRVQQNFDKRMLDSLPNARDMWSLLAETPGMQLNRFDVGGSTAGTQTTYMAYGEGGQNRPLIEGINTTEGTSASGFYFDYGSFDEVVVGTAGNSVEMPSGGTITNFIGKSGGNQFSGELYYEYEGNHVQSSNVTADQLARGYANLPKNVIQSLGLDRSQANTLTSYKNFNASIGGPIVKDKLWLWAGYLHFQNVTYQPASGAILDGTPFKTQLDNYTGKMTYQMTPKDKLIGYFQWGVKAQPNRTDSIVSGPQLLNAGATLDQQSPSWVGKLEYNRSFSNRGFFEIRAGQFGYNFKLDGNSEDPRREDTSTLAVSGGGRHWELDRRRSQVHTALTLFEDNKLGGNHQFKVGGEYQHETGRERWGAYYANNVVQLFNNGVASSVRLGLPVDSQNGLDNIGLYLNDNYTRKRVTLNIGVRYDHYNSFLPAQSRPASTFSPQAAQFAEVSSLIAFNHVVPRVGVIFDVTGDGKTVFKANYGRYYFNPGVGLATSLNPNTNQQYTQYAWTDLNGDRLWERGEEGAVQQQFGGPAGIILDPNLKNSYTDEFSTWLQRELPGAVGARIGFVYKMDRNGYQQYNQNRPSSAWTTPATVIDPGADGTTGTGDDRTVNALGLPANIAALPVVNYVYNPPGYDQNYKTLEVGANKRFTKKWSMVGSYAITWFSEFGSNYLGSGNGGNYGSNSDYFFAFANSGGFPITPNGKQDAAVFSQWNFKVHGTFVPAWELHITPIFRMQQGFPYGRVFSATVTGQTQNFYAEDLNAHRMETIKQLDLRLDRTFKVSGRVKLQALFDVYNVFNANTELNIRATTGTFVISETGVRIPNFNTPTTILPPRIARLSGRLSW
jgi:hypothetical protein